MSSLSAGQDDGDLIGSKQILDKEFDILSTKTLHARRLQDKIRPLRSDSSP